MTTVFLDAVFKPFFKIVHDTDQQLTIDRTNFLTDGFLRIIQWKGFVSVNIRFQISPKEKKSHVERSGGWGRLRHISKTGNEVPGKHVSNSGHWLICSMRCGTILLKPHIGTGKECRRPRPPLGLPTEYYPFKRCQVPVGHPVHAVVFEDFVPVEWYMLVKGENILTTVLRCYGLSLTLV